MPTEYDPVADANGPANDDTNPGPKVLLQGRVTNLRTARMFYEATSLGGPMRITQGSYSTSVSASAGTHSGGGVLDISVRGMSASEIQARIRALRLVGFAAWYRTSADGFTPHIHAVAVGTKDLSPSAARQVESLRRGRNGLANNRSDPHRDMGLPVIAWESYDAC